MTSCDGILVPEQSLRNALLCARETVPTLQASLQKCEDIHRVETESLQAILSHQQKEIEELKRGPGVIKIAGYVLSGAALGAAVAAAFAASR